MEVDLVMTKLRRQRGLCVFRLLKDSPTIFVKDITPMGQLSSSAACRCLSLITVYDDQRNHYTIEGYLIVLILKEDIKSTNRISV